MPHCPGSLRARGTRGNPNPSRYQERDSNPRPRPLMEVTLAITAVAGEYRPRFLRALPLSYPGVCVSSLEAAAVPSSQPPPLGPIRPGFGGLDRTQRGRNRQVAILADKMYPMGAFFAPSSPSGDGIDVPGVVCTIGARRRNHVTTQARRLLLKDGVGTDAVRQLAAGNWFLWNRIEPLDNQPLVYEWATATSDCRIRYVDDHRLGLRWFDVEGPGCASTVEVIRRSLPVYERAEIITLCGAAKTEAEGIWAAYKLAVTAGPTFDAKLLRLLRGSRAITATQAYERPRCTQWSRRGGANSQGSPSPWRRTIRTKTCGRGPRRSCGHCNEERSAPRGPAWRQWERRGVSAGCGSERPYRQSHSSARDRIRAWTATRPRKLSR